MRQLVRDYPSAATRLPPEVVQLSGLDFWGNADAAGDMRFRFTGAALLPAFPATYIWRIKFRDQAGYFTTFFWGPDGPFTAQGYYGAHPYPVGAGDPLLITTHRMEISVEGTDATDGDGGVATDVEKGRWYIQALVVREVASNEIELKFYFDLPDTTKVITYTTRTDYTLQFAGVSNPHLGWGAAAWAGGGERLNGVLRGIQIYATNLSLSDVLTEAVNHTVNNPQTSAGQAGVWFMNQNPTPNDISDKTTVIGHTARNPVWVDSSHKATLWTP